MLFRSQSQALFPSHDTALTSLSKLLYTTTGSYDTTYNYNAVTKFTSDSKLVIAYYSHLMKFDTSTNTMTTFSKTTAATYPFSMQQVTSSYTGATSGVLVILNSKMTSGQDIFINIVSYSTLVTMNSVVMT